MYDSRSMVRGWMDVNNRFKPRGRGNSFYGYGNENMDGLNELNRGPRGKGSKNQKGFTPVALPIKGEDDVHNSIKYNIWASTPNGNKKLDVAYQEAQQKDVPNSLLKHITLENDENKPVTNNRDTQELLKIFMDHVSKQCILDDFELYEDRQKRIQEKKAKQYELKSQKPSKVLVVLNKESLPPLHTNGHIQFTENGEKPVILSDKKHFIANGIANGVANAC
ncbi:hypothetical protein R3W88_033741 [Solanum pinnatisectum]|uniref:YTH domain-containing family protein n=1 Tax=Solanum pinnatisectum TaxID=50273 RepID=A0AAV9K0I4_9SOLN|nr:hypothetical protein R3W88_033741 [Solanum pinnatisectum]